MAHSLRKVYYKLFPGANAGVSPGGSSLSHGDDGIGNDRSPFFSIIVPVYNVEPYLRECLDSAAGQTFGDWECICVDDGSTDGSGAILDEYAAKDLRFRVIHQANAGVSAARNAAMASMRGEWFLFLDGDDALLQETLDGFCSLIHQHPHMDGILTHPYNDCLWNGIPSARKTAGSFDVLVLDASKEDLFLGKYAANGFTYARIYKRSVFGNIRFKIDMRLSEDVCFWFDALCIPARWMIVEARYYLYRLRRDSVLGSQNPHLCVQSLESVLHAFDALDSNIGFQKRLKMRYCKRFPYNLVTYLDIAILNRCELSADEWRDILAKANEIVRRAGGNPFGFFRIARARLAPLRFAGPAIRVLATVERILSTVRTAAGALLRR